MDREVMIPVDQILISQSLRPLVPSLVIKLIPAMCTRGQLTPIYVKERHWFMRLFSKKQYYLIDGLHRITAAQRLGWTTIRCYILRGELV